MKTINGPLGFDQPAEGIYLCVLPIDRGGFGVYANMVLIAIHNDQAAADAHCQRLRHQQAQG